ncbi:MAG: 3'(2'),5'-bisphosphate nucleotidase CysQ [Gammaproteobacteria bacterium]|nr:3'(2'),5'-bisphosphate nucleotidase CysQ [Gammaproteobacteria bacterium]
MTELNLQNLLEQTIKLSVNAGDEILKIYNTDFSVESKDDKSPLTAADMASHHCLVEGLQRLTPELPILSEESSDISFEQRQQWETYWLLDPLDGTKEFIKRNGEFTVNVALIRNQEPIMGVVYVPVSGICYSAAQGLGAWKQELPNQTESINVRDQAISPFIVVGSRSHQTEELIDFLKRLGSHELVSMGSSLKICLVAEGKADLYPRIGLTSEWDTAAAQCVVEQAGGHVTDLSGQRLTYNAKESFLNPYFLVFGDDSQNWVQYAG